MPKKCLVCKSPEVKLSTNWIKENQFHGNYGQILKEVYIGNVKENPKDRKIINTVYYCSWQCFNQWLEHEEEKDWAKGKCQECGLDLVVINEKCQNEKHKKESHYFPLFDSEEKGEGK